MGCVLMQTKSMYLFKKDFSKLFFKGISKTCAIFMTTKCFQTLCTKSKKVTMGINLSRNSSILITVDYEHVKLKRSNKFIFLQCQCKANSFVNTFKAFFSLFVLYI